MKIPDPVGYAEMTKIRDGNNPPLQQVVESEIRKFPVEAIGREECFVKWWPITEKMDLKIGNEIKVFAPALIVPALLHLIYANLSMVDGGIAVFYTCGKNESSEHSG